MTLLGLLNQTVTIASQSSYGADGRPAFSAGTSVRARVEPKTKRVLMPDGTILTTDAFMIVGPDTTIVTDDKVTYSSVDYKVIEIFPVPGETGSTHHIEVGLKRWP